MTIRAKCVDHVLMAIRTLLLVAGLACLSYGAGAGLEAGLGAGALAQGSGGKLMTDGEKSLGEGQYDTAIDQLSKAIKSGSLGKPEMAKAFILRGQALQGKGSQARAVADFTNALWLESLSGSDTARAFALRGSSRQKLGQTKSAAEDFRKAEAAQPGISKQFGGTSGKTASRSGGTASRPTSSGSDDEGFFGSLFGGSGETPTATGRDSERRRVSRGASAKVVRTTPRKKETASGQTTRSSSDGFFSNIFGGDDEAETKPATDGPRRLVASGQSTINRTRLSPSGSVNRPGVLSDILPGDGSGPAPKRKPGTGQRITAVTPQNDLTSPSPSTSQEEPGFFERVFSGSGSSSGNSNRNPQLKSPSRGAQVKGPTRLAARSDGPPESVPATAVTRSGPRTQRDTSLPTFVNQPRLTDRILANDAVEPGGSRSGPTRIANLQKPQRGVQPPSRRIDAPVVNVEPAQLDWNTTTRVERGQVAAPILRPKPRTSRPVAAQPVTRRPVTARNTTQTAQPAPRIVVAPTKQRQVVERQTAGGAPAGRAPAQDQPSFGAVVRTAGQTAGATVRSAVDWVGGAFGSGGTRTAAPQRQRVASAPVRQAAKTTYRAPAKPVPQKRATNSAGGYVVQLAARQNRKDAEAAARKVKTRHGRVFAGAKPYIVRADIPGKGTYYRVRVGPYRTQAQVASICAQLKGRGQDCFATR